MMGRGAAAPADDFLALQGPVVIIRPNAWSAKPFGVLTGMTRRRAGSVERYAAGPQTGGPHPCSGVRRSTRHLSRRPQIVSMYVHGTNTERWSCIRWAKIAGRCRLAGASRPVGIVAPEGLFETDGQRLPARLLLRGPEDSRPAAHLPRAGATDDVDGRRQVRTVRPTSGRGGRAPAQGRG